MNSIEFTRWMAFATMEPFGAHIDNFRFGQIPAAIYNVAPRGKNAKPLAPSSFYPNTRSSSPDLTPEQAEYLRKKHGKRRNSNR